MKVLLTSLLLIAPWGDPVKDGLRLYREGRYAEAVEAFRAALKDDPDSARLNYNLALALWRAGDADGAETAAEKSSALSNGDFDGLRDGILGNLRYDRARTLADAKVEPQKEVTQLEEALKAASTARDHFERSAADLLRRSPESGAEVQRNLERALKLEEELRKRLEDAKKKQQDEKQKKPGDEDQKDDPNKTKKKDPTQDDDKDDQKDADKKQKEQPEPDPKQKEEDEKKEPKPEDPKKDDREEKKPEEEKKNKPHDPGKPQEVPGEYDPDKQLTPEQRRQLLKRLKEFDENLQKLKAARRAARPKVEKDW